MTKKGNGYVAISTVLVVGAVVLTIGISVILNGINESQSALADTKSEVALGLVNACAQDGLIRLSKNNSIPGTIVLPEGTCTVTINSQVGNDWDVTYSVTLGGYTKSVKVVATRTTTVTINSWLEI